MDAGKPTLTQLGAGNTVNKDVLTYPRPISALLLPIFLIGQVICFCVPMQAAAHTETDEADHACCSHESSDADYDGAPGEKKHDCDRCRGAQALIAQRAADQSQALKLLTAMWTPFARMTAIASPGIELPNISESFTLERPPPDLFVWHCALLN
jgi:hypothetical protein